MSGLRQGPPGSNQPDHRGVEETELHGGGVKFGLLDRRSRPQTGAQREKARVITIAWGDRYITDLVSLTVPALLAPGNLPALAAAFDCEFVIVTEAKFFDRIRRAPAMIRLLDVCDIRLLPIDDLLSPSYGITLTYALVRGFADLGREMVDTHLFFLNADFIVADGSYRTLVDRIGRGERLIVSPSYCMVLEATIEDLRAGQDRETGAIAIAPRKLAKLIIENRHNTIRAKTVNQQLFRIHRYDQFYWSVNEHTMLARQLPIAVVYMRPERALTELQTFWDYGVISEYCPTTRPCVLGDSDEFLMAELRTEDTFRELLHLGWPTVKEIAADLSSFTTKDQRDYGRHTLVLHAGELPPDLGGHVDTLGGLVDSIYDRLSAPVSHRNHVFWTAGYRRFQKMHHVQRRNYSNKTRTAEDIRPAGELGHETNAEEQRNAQNVLQARRSEIETKLDEVTARYRAERDSLQRELAELSGINQSQHHPSDPRATPETSELLQQSKLPDEPGADPKTQFVGGKLAWFGELYRSVFGSLPHTKPFHPFHTILCQPAAILARVAADREPDCLVISSGDSLGASLASSLGGRRLTITPAMARKQLYDDLIGERQFDLCFCDFSFENLFFFREFVERIRPRVRAGGSVVLFYHNASNVRLDTWTAEFAQKLFPIVGNSRISFSGSWPGALASRWFSRTLKRYDLFRPAGFLVVGVTLLVTGLLARLAFAIERRRHPQSLPRYCTGMIIQIDLP